MSKNNYQWVKNDIIIAENLRNAACQHKNFSDHPTGLQVEVGGNI